MDGKFFDIPFRRTSSDSDFTCKDGEVYGIWEGKSVTSAPGFENTANAGRPDIPDIEFGIVRDALAGWHIHPDRFPSKSVVASDPSMDYWNKMAQQVLSRFQNDATRQRLFVAPFYVMAVWKLKDGSRLSPTFPLLMIPNSDVPPVSISDVIDSEEIEFKVAGAVCSLYFKMQAPETLRDYVGIIESLEILVSEPLEKYDSYSAFLPSRRVITDSWCRSLDLDTGLVSDTRICTETLPLAWKANVNGSLSVNDMESLRFYPFAEVPLREIDRCTDWMATNIDTKGIFSGLWDLAYGKDGITFGEIQSGSTSTKADPFIIEGKGEDIKVLTRPLKLSGAGLLKSMKRLYLRGLYNPANLVVKVYGSRDMLKWWLIAKRDGGTAVSLPCTSFRFYRIEITGLLNEGENLQGFTIC